MPDRAEIDGYMECSIYVEHGACSCSTGVPGNVCPLGLGAPTAALWPRPSEPTMEKLAYSFPSKWLTDDYHWRIAEQMVEALRSMPIEQRLEVAGIGYEQVTEYGVRLSDET